MGLGTGSSLLDQAVKIDPRAYYPRVEYLNSLIPKWGGSVRLMDAFVKECKNSRMSQTDKARIEARYYFFLGEQAGWDKDYRLASEYYAKAYQVYGDPESLYWSGKSALDGGFKESAFRQFDALVKAYPQYDYGYSNRGYLFESYVKNDEMAFKDYVVAADLGNDWAQNRVGWWYMTGRHVLLDYDRAELYFRRAAAEGNQYAITNLANLDKIRKESPVSRQRALSR